RIEFRTADLQDVDLYIILTCQFLQLFLDAVYLTTAFTDDDTGFGGVNGNDQLAQGSFNHDLGNTALVDTGVQVCPDLVIFDQPAGVVLFISVPVRFPSADDA